MASGLAALLDDVAVIAKVAAASLDDVGAAAGRAGAKAVGVVVDDAAVTPRFVTGFTPDRELPVVFAIARGSLRNKVLILLPAALLLGAVVPWALTPLLMLGGTWLCYEGAEKLLEAVRPHEASLADAVTELSSPDHERRMIAGAVRTDFVLSAEIMAIALGEVADRPTWTQGVVLLLVAVVLTVGVYGLVAAIVKMDDVGLHLARREARPARLVGRALVRGMPLVLSALSAIGIAAMSWVGGGIVLHGLHAFHLTPLPEVVARVVSAAAAAAPVAPGVVAWVVEAACAGGFGLVLGGGGVAVHHAAVAVRERGRDTPPA